MLKISKNRKSFTLVEVIVAVTLFAFFIGAAFSLFVASQQNVTTSRHRFQAANLAREGAELVREIRDTAWLHNATWAIFTTNGPCYGLGGVNPGNPLKLDFLTNYWDQRYRDCAFEHWRLVGDTEPITQNNVNYTRAITVDNINTTDTKKITVTVSWDEAGKAKEIKMITYLTDWIQ